MPPVPPNTRLPPIYRRRKYGGPFVSTSRAVKLLANLPRPDDKVGDLEGMNTVNQHLRRFNDVTVNCFLPGPNYCL